MMYKAIEMADGEDIDSESGPISLHLEPANRTGEIHIENPAESGHSDHCTINGNTYQRKDLIKKLPYGETGTEWTGETWTVHKEQTANLAAVLCVAGVRVTLGEGAVRSDPEWGWYHEQEQPDDGGEDEIEVGGPVDAAEKKVLLSWVSDLVELGVIESEWDYAERHKVMFFHDDNTGNAHELLADTECYGAFDTRKASPPQV